VLHLFIDTNVLLRFYSYSDDTLAEVDKLSALVKAKEIRLLVTEQVVDERARNRDREVSESMKRLDQLGSSVQMPRFAEHHQAAGQFIEAMKQAKAAKAELLAAIKEEMLGDGLRADRVIQQMFDASSVLARTPEIIQRAVLRRNIGNPPGKKESLGDQINWEIILEHVPEGTDLHIVSRDGDFRGGVVDGVANFFLRGEWNHKKKAKLHLYAGLSEFAKKHFPDIKVPSDAAKSAALKKLIGSGSFMQTHAAIAELAPLLDEISEAEGLAALQAAVSNGQIGGIIEDEDVASFYGKLHAKLLFSTSPELDEQLSDLSSEVFGVPF
jgi:predicted nucleic acid-binding protein